MEKKNYSQPAMQCYVVKPSCVICGSGDSTGSIGNGRSSSSEEPSSSTQNGVTGIFSESKSSLWENEEE